MITDAYLRTVAMKMVAGRACDYMRSASPEDRRYLLYNPVVKMKVTTEGEKAVDALWDVIAAKGFEEDMYFEMASRDIRALPKLEGTVHVNIALIVKFMASYLFDNTEYPPIPRRDDAANDDFLFDQGPTKGLGRIKFHDWVRAFDNYASVPNVKRFREQLDVFHYAIADHQPTEEQRRDIDFLMAVGNMFALVVYAQLALEDAAIRELDEDLLAQIFDVFVRDFAGYAVEMFEKTSTSEEQGKRILEAVKKPVADQARYDYVWNSYVLPLAGSYEMNQ